MALSEVTAAQNVWKVAAVCHRVKPGLGVLGDILSKTGQGILQKWSDHYESQPVGLA